MIEVEQWKAIGYVQVIVYSLTIASLLFVVISSVSKGSFRCLKITSVVFLAVFNVVKFAGGITMILLLYGKNTTDGFAIATFILNMASLGFLVKSLLQFVLGRDIEEEVKEAEEKEVAHESDELKDGFSLESGSQVANSEHQNPDHPTKIEVLKRRFTRVLTVMVTAAVALNIVGGVEIASDANDAGTYFKVSSILFLVTIVLMAGISLFYFRRFGKHGPLNILILLSCTLLVLRVIYSLISAIKGMDILQHPNDFTFLFGKYQYYCFLDFMEEILVNISLILLNYLYSRAYISLKHANHAEP